MPYELFLALRYLYSRRRRTMARITALIAIVGIAFGVAVLIVALALANGFRDEMRDKILRGTAHISLMRKDGAAISDWLELSTRIRQIEGVRSASATTYDGALLSSSNGAAYVVLRGVESRSAHVVNELRRTLIEGSIDPILTGALSSGKQETAQSSTSGDSNKSNSIEPDLETYKNVPSDAAMPHAVVGVELANRTGIHVGDVVQIVSGDAQLTPLGLAPRFRRLRIAGIFKSGLYEYDATWIYVSLPIASSISGAQPDAASVISVEVADIYSVNQVTSRIRDAIGPAYTTVDWQEANRPLFAALTLERRMGAIVIGLVIFIATLNISATLVLVVVERRTDIAILIAMGARSANIMLVFMIEGALVGLVGAVSGVLIGIFACLIGNRYKLVSLPADVYSLNNIPFHWVTSDIILAAIVAFTLSLLATVFPARAASRVRPAEALRERN